MRKVNAKLLYVLLVIGMASMYLPVLPTQAATTRTSVGMQLKATKQENRPLSWAVILDFLRHKKVTTGSRTIEGKICAIAPGLIETRVVWNDRPLFLWQGIMQKIEVRLPSSKDAFWEQPVSEADRSATYNGSALQQGRTYQWVLTDQYSQPSSFNFKIMATKERNVIAAELMALEAQLKTKKATAEAIALQRANYFAQRQLWSDVLQEVFEVKNPSAALTRIKQELPAELLGDTKCSDSRQTQKCKIPYPLYLGELEWQLLETPKIRSAA